jgi:YD repeat-containing protein
MDLQKALTYSNLNGNIDTITEIFLDAEGNLLKSQSEEIFYADVPYYAQLFGQNAKKYGNNVNYVFENNKIVSYTQVRKGKKHSATFKYDNTGNLIETKQSYDNDVKAIYENGKLKSFIMDGAGRFEFTYDEIGNIISMKTIKNRTQSYKYDDAGQIIYADSYDTFNYEYNNGLTKSAVRGNGSKYSYSYRFDDKDNWIEKKIEVDGVVKGIIQRTINYIK